MHGRTEKELMCFKKSSHVIWTLVSKDLQWGTVLRILTTCRKISYFKTKHRQASRTCLLNAEGRWALDPDYLVTATADEEVTGERRQGSSGRETFTVWYSGQCWSVGGPLALETMTKSLNTSTWTLPTPHFLHIILLSTTAAATLIRSLLPFWISLCIA